LVEGQYILFTKSILIGNSAIAPFKSFIPYKIVLLVIDALEKDERYVSGVEKCIFAIWSSKFISIIVITRAIEF
jgi:hypothetical protein